MIQMMIQICTIKASMMYGVDQNLINTIIKAESNYNVHAVSTTHDHGLMQLHKQEVYEVCENIKRGTDLLNKCKQTYEKKLGDAWFVCYNTGIRGASGLTRQQALQHPYYKKIRSAYVSNKIHQRFPDRNLPKRLHDG